MDEQERQLKLQAGKEALLAFQKKKKVTKKKKRKPEASTASISSSSSQQTGPVGDNSEATLPRSGGGSPIPFDDGSWTQDTSVPLHSSVLGNTPPSQLAQEQDSTTHRDPNISAPPSSSSLDTATRAHIEQSDWPDGAARRHTSPVSPDDNAVAVLEQQLKASNEAKKQVQDELNSLRENQSVALEETRNEVAGAYQAQVASLQQSLMQSEYSLQALERQFAETKAAHSAEIESIVKQQEQLRVSLLHEKDQKHAAHVLRLTAELSAQQEFVDDGARDSGEQEAERIRMIKESMKDMHEREKQQMVSEHEADKVRLSEEFRKQMEGYTQQMEQVANTKIKEMHGQFMSAHQAVLEQKSATELAMEQCKAKLEEVEVQLETLTEEKHSLEEKYHSVLQTHSAEVEEMRSNARNLEERLNTWKDKAAGLESRLEVSSKHQERGFQEVREQLEAKLQGTVEEYKLKVSTLQLAVEKQQQETTLLREQLQRAEEEAKIRHEREMEEMKSQHGSEVRLLEQSISEHSGDRASLEAAELHMSSLQKQLEAYRMEETNYSARIAELQQQHAADVELLKQHCEREKAEEIKAVHAQFASQIEAMEKELQGLANSDAKLGQGEVQEHQRELQEVQRRLQESHKLAMNMLRSELEAAHSTAAAEFRAQKEEEVEQLRAKLEQEWSAKFEAVRAGVVTELEEARDTEIEELKVEHSKAMNVMNQSLAEKEAALAEVKARVTSLEAELGGLRNEETEWLELQKDMMSQLELSQRELDEANIKLARGAATEAQLREQCQKYESTVRSVEADCHIAQSANAQLQQSLEHSQQEIEEWKAKVEELQGEIGELAVMESTNQEQSQKLLDITDQLAEKNVTIADLQAQNDSMNTEVFALTQKCQQQASAIEMLQRQVESAGDINEEITALQQQLSELAPIREHHAKLKEQVTLLEKAVQSKDREIADQQSELEQAAVQTREMKAQWSAKLDEVTKSSAGEIEALKMEIASYGTRENELRQQIQQHVAALSQAESSRTAQQEELTGMREEVHRLQGLLKEATDNADQLREANGRLEEELQSFQEQLSYQQQSKDDSASDLQASNEQLQRCVAVLTAEKDKLSLELAKMQEDSEQRLEECGASWEVKVQQLERAIEELRGQLDAKDLAFSEMQSDLTQQLTEAEMRESSLRQSLDSTQRMQEQIGLVAGQKTTLEESLSRARRKLTEKVREKETLEKDLGFHRAELERRLGEKQRLEELLFEKARFEQELLNQKEQLQNDLKDIESKLKVQVGKVEERDQLLEFKARELEQNEKEHKTREAEMMQELGQQHEHQVASLVASHNQLVVDLKQDHKGDISSIRSKHKKQLEELREGLEKEHRAQVASLQVELEQRRSEEVSTLRAVLEREKAAAISRVEEELRKQYSAAWRSMEEEPKERELEGEVVAERQRFERAQQHRVEALTAVLSEENRRQLLALLEGIKQAHEAELQEVRVHDERVVRKKSPSPEVVMREGEGEGAQPTGRFDQELQSQVALKEEELRGVFEARLAESEAQWRARLAEAVEVCRKEQAATNSAEIEELKRQHSEEVENALKACREAQEQLGALEVRHAGEVDRMLAEQEVHAAQMKSLRAELERLQVKGESTREGREGPGGELEALQQQVRELQAENQDLVRNHQLQMEQLKAQQETTLTNLSHQHEEKTSNVLSAHEAELKHLQSEYETKIRAFQGQVESLQERLHQEQLSLQANLQQTFEKESLAKESQYREEIASLQTQWEQRLQEAGLQHTHEVARITSELRGQLAEKELETEKSHRELVHAHELEKADVMAQHERDMQEMERVHAKRLQELTSELSTSPTHESGQLVQQLQKELELQKQRLQRQHDSDLKLQEQKLRNELSIEHEKLRSKLEEQCTEQVAQAHTEAALKNAVQVEQISQQLLAEKQRALSHLEAELVARHEQEVARLKEERREAVDVCRAELESARSEYQSKIAELEVAMASEHEKQVTMLTVQQQKSWSKREERLRQELEGKHRRHMEQVVAECNRAKEKALNDMRVTMQLTMESEVRAAQERHELALQQTQAHLQSSHQQELAAVQESTEQGQRRLREQHVVELEAKVEEVRAQLVKEHMAKFQKMTEKLQAVHQTELMTVQREREVEADQQREEVMRLREELEERQQLDMEQLTKSHKAEVGILLQQYQSQLDEVKSTHQQQLHQLRLSMEATVAVVKGQGEAQLTEREEEHERRLEELQEAHKASLSALEEASAEKMALVQRELEEAREENQSLQSQLEGLRRELSAVHVVAQEQKEELVRLGEERERLGRQLGEASARLREVEEQGAREHREDTTSLSMLHSQLTSLAAEKSALQSSLAVLQSSVAGCLQLTGLIEQTLGPSPTPSQPWHTPQQQHHLGGDSLQQLPLSEREEEEEEEEEEKEEVEEEEKEEGEEGRREEGEEGQQGEGEGGEEEDTLTPPTTSPSSAVVGVASASSMAQTRSMASLQGKTVFRQTPSDDSGLASQQASVVNSEATMLTTPLVDVDLQETTPSTPLAEMPSPPPHSHHLTILPLDTTTLSPERPQVPPAGYDHSQLGMLSISFLDATQHASTHQPPPPHPSAQGTDLSITSMDQSMPPLSLSDLPALQGELSRLHQAVSALLQCYITLSAEAKDYQQKWVTSTTQLREMLSSEGEQRGHVMELETDCRQKEARLVTTTEQLAAAEEKIQGLVSEVEEARGETGRMGQELQAARGALADSQQQVEETRGLLREKSEEAVSLQERLASQERENQQQVQTLAAQTAQLQEELQAAQRNCGSAVHEGEALREEIRKLVSVRMALEGQLHSQQEEMARREVASAQALKEKDDEIRELQEVRVQLALREEAEERLVAERDELQNKLACVEHQLALVQSSPVEEQASRIQELTARESQLSAELSEQTVTCQSLGSRLQEAQVTLSQASQENLNLKMAQAQLEGEVRRLRDELQRKETALHRAEAARGGQARELQRALEELETLRGRLQEVEEEEEEGSGDRESGSGSEGGEAGGMEEVQVVQEGPMTEQVSSLQKELQRQREVEGSLQTQLGLLRDTLSSKDRELEALRMARAHQERVVEEMRAQVEVKEEECREKLEEMAAQNREEVEKIVQEHQLTLQGLSTFHTAGAAVVEGGGAESVLQRIAELAPILSQEAEEVKELSKTITSLNAEASRLQSDLRQREGVISQLEMEVKELQALLTSVTAELEEVRATLTEYQQTEDSLTRSAHTITSLHEELKSSKAREADLQRALREATLSQTRLQQLEQEHTVALSEQGQTLSSLQESLQQERAAKGELSVQMSAVQRQLREGREARLAAETETRRLQGRLELLEGELGQAREDSRSLEEAGQEREEELERVRTHLQSAETERKEQGDHYSQLLDNEHRIVSSLKASLHAKEKELTQAMDKFLQEKLASAKAHGELSAMGARLERAQQEIQALQRKVTSLRAEGESKTGSEMIQQLEIEQVRRQLQQLQASMEQQSSTLSNLRREKLELQGSVSRLLAQVSSLQEEGTHQKELQMRYRSALDNKEEDMRRLQQQVTQLQAASAQSSTLDLLETKLVRLYAKYRRAEVHRKALVFQKNYLKCQVDAFFQTQQTALVMMADMGAPVARAPKARPHLCPLLKFKTAVHVVIAAMRFQYVVRRKHQYLQSYSNKIERQKHISHTATGTMSSTSATVAPASGNERLLSSHPQNSPRIPLSHTTFVARSRATMPPMSRALPAKSKSSSGRHGRVPGLPTAQKDPQLTAYLSGLETKLSGTVN